MEECSLMHSPTTYCPLFPRTSWKLTVDNASVMLFVRMTVPDVTKVPRGGKQPALMTLTSLNLRITLSSVSRGMTSVSSAVLSSHPSLTATSWEEWCWGANYNGGRWCKRGLSSLTNPMSGHASIHAWSTFRSACATIPPPRPPKKNQIFFLLQCIDLHPLRYEDTASDNITMTTRCFTSAGKRQLVSGMNTVTL